MENLSIPRVPACENGDDEGERLGLVGENKGNGSEIGGSFYWLLSPLHWLRRLSRELHWSFVFGVISVNGVSQGLGGAVGRVASDYYWKDVQKVQPPEAQVYQGIAYVPWIVKPIWGLLTDVVPIAGYRRRPYLILAGLLGVLSMLTLSLHDKLPIIFAVLAMMGGNAAVVIGDVCIDACVAENSIINPPLTSDMQSLCSASESVGALLGFSISGLLVDAIGPQGVLGLLSIPAALIVFNGTVLKELFMTDFAYGQVCSKLLDAIRTMYKTLKCPVVWKPCLYMYVSLALSLNIHEGLFFWYTDSTSGPSFSEETIGIILAVGTVGSLLGVVLYQNKLKSHPFRSVLFWSQLFSSFSGMLDLVLVMRLNLKLGIPDFVFVVMDDTLSKFFGSLKWMPFLVISAKLCPPGIEGTFFALIMSMDNFGTLTASWGGGLLLHSLKVTRDNFRNLWAAILFRNMIRAVPLALLFLVPPTDHGSELLPDYMLPDKERAESLKPDFNDVEVELAFLIENN